MRKSLMAALVVGLMLASCGGESGDGADAPGSSAPTDTSTTSAPSATPTSAESAVETTDSNTLADFIALADAICAPARTQIELNDETPVDESITLEELAFYAREQLVIADQMNEDLQKLSPPAEISDTWDRWLESGARVNLEYASLVEEMEGGDLEAYARTFDRVDPAIRDFSELGVGITELGFEDCGGQSVLFTISSEP